MCTELHSACQPWLLHVCQLQKHSVVCLRLVPPHKTDEPQRESETPSPGQFTPTPSRGSRARDFVILALGCIFWKRTASHTQSNIVPPTQPASRSAGGLLPPSLPPHIPPDHVSQCSGCDMAHPQLAHTHFCRGRGKMGGTEGRKEGAREGGRRRHYSAGAGGRGGWVGGGGDYYSLPYPSSTHPPTAAHTCLHVCVCAGGSAYASAQALAHAHVCQACDRQPQPPF